MYIIISMPLGPGNCTYCSMCAPYQFYSKIAHCGKSTIISRLALKESKSLLIDIDCTGQSYVIGCYVHMYYLLPFITNL